MRRISGSKRRGKRTGNWRKLHDDTFIIYNIFITLLEYINKERWDGQNIYPYKNKKCIQHFGWKTSSGDFSMDRKKIF
jgi:hypothetical protein